MNELTEQHIQRIAELETKVADLVGIVERITSALERATEIQTITSMRINRLGGFVEEIRIELGFTEGQ